MLNGAAMPVCGAIIWGKIITLLTIPVHLFPYVWVGEQGVLERDVKYWSVAMMVIAFISFVASFA